MSDEMQRIKNQINALKSSQIMVLQWLYEVSAQIDQITGEQNNKQMRQDIFNRIQSLKSLR